MFKVTFLCPMEFDAFPFDVHNCFFRVQSLEPPETALQFRYTDNGSSGVIWKTQTILEHSVSFKKLEEEGDKSLFYLSLRHCGCFRIAFLYSGVRIWCLVFFQNKLPFKWKSVEALGKAVCAEFEASGVAVPKDQESF